MNHCLVIIIVIPDCGYRQLLVFYLPLCVEEATPLLNDVNTAAEMVSVGVLQEHQLWVSINRVDYKCNRI